jgi:lipopolysaccharide/colanic/teichoic acid biosynthesis glycosyltransferase
LAKRAIDASVSAALLIATAPLLAACAVAVKLSSAGPVLFRQRRIGKDGRPFDLLKFRSMMLNDDSDLTWSVLDDDRVTAIGRLLRNSSLDELPQLWNILRGDMSLVGPRPERPHFVSEFGADIPGYDDRHRVSGGLTGWAQIHGLRGPTSIEDRVLFDNYYIEHWSLFDDVAILLRTGASIMRDFLRTGAAEGTKLTRPANRPATRAPHVIDIRADKTDDDVLILELDDTPMERLSS